MSKPPKKPAPRDDARSESSPPATEDVASLIKERRKYVDWIAALDARKSQTPAHVFARVHADYEDRLRAVSDRLAEHRGSLAEEQETLRARMDEVETEIRQHEDRRAEIELRAHVGELGAAALTEALRSVDTELERLGARRGSIEVDLKRVTDFFAATEGVDHAPTPAGPRATPSSFDELSFLQSVVGPAEDDKPEPAGTAQPVSQTPAAPVPRVAESRPSRETRSTEARELELVAEDDRSDRASRPSAPVPRQPEPSASDAPGAAPSVSPASSGASTPSPESKDQSAAALEARPGTPPASAAADTDAPSAGPSASAPDVASTPGRPESPASAAAPAADTSTGNKAPAAGEMAASEVASPSAGLAEPAAASRTDVPVEKAVELEPSRARPSLVMQSSSMTFEPAAEKRISGIIKADEAPPSLLDGITSSAATEKPYAANVASNNPLSLRAVASDIKTLKCRECSAMNDPAEWYCERCGAELAAL